MFANCPPFWDRVEVEDQLGELIGRGVVGERHPVRLPDVVPRRRRDEEQLPAGRDQSLGRRRGRIGGDVGDAGRAGLGAVGTPQLETTGGVVADEVGGVAQQDEGRHDARPEAGVEVLHELGAGDGAVGAPELGARPSLAAGEQHDAARQLRRSEPVDVETRGGPQVDGLLLASRRELVGEGVDADEARVGRVGERAVLGEGHRAVVGIVDHRQGARSRVVGEHARGVDGQRRVDEPGVVVVDRRHRLRADGNRRNRRHERGGGDRSEEPMTSHRSVLRASPSPTRTRSRR